MKIFRRLIIGSNGDVSNYFCNFLASKKLYFRTLNREVRNNTDIAYRLSEFELTQYIELNIDIIYIFASGLIPSSTLSDYDREVEHLKSPLLSLIAQIKREIKIVYISSGGCVYEKKSEKHAESAKNVYYNYYGRFKLEMEQAILEIAEVNDNLNYTIIRPSNIYGTYKGEIRKQGVINNIIHSINNDRPITLWNDGNSVRDYVHIEDFVYLIMRIEGYQQKYGLFNVATGNGTKTSDLIDLFQSRLNYQFKIDKIYSDFQDDQDINILDIGKVKDMFNFNPLTIEVGVQKIINEYINL